MINELADTNRAGMEHVSLLVITLGYKEFAEGEARSDNTIIDSNQERATIDRWGNGDWIISFGSLKIRTKMIRVICG